MTWITGVGDRRKEAGRGRMLGCPCCQCLLWIVTTRPPEPACRDAGSTDALHNHVDIHTGKPPSVHVHPFSHHHPSPTPPHPTPRSAPDRLGHRVCVLTSVKIELRWESLETHTLEISCHVSGVLTEERHFTRPTSDMYHDFNCCALIPMIFDRICH